MCVLFMCASFDLFEALVKAHMLNVSHRIAHIGLVHMSLNIVCMYFMSLVMGAYKRSTMQTLYQASRGGRGFSVVTIGYVFLL